MTDGPSLIHPSYRHLERHVRLAGLTLAQWSQLVGAGLVAWLLASALPFPTTWNLSLATTLTGTPLAVALAAGTGRVDPLVYARALIRWRRSAAIYRPRAVAPRRPASLQIEALWD